MSGRPTIRAFFDEATNTFSYLVADPATRRAAVIDPVLEYDPKSGEVDIRSVETILAAAAEAGLTIEWSLETHAHADHLSGSPYVKTKTGAGIGIGENIKEVQRIFRPVFNATDLRTDGATSTGCSRTANGSRSGSSRLRSFTPLGTRPPASATRSRMPCSSAIPCSCRTTVPREPTSPAATRTSSIGRSASS